MLSGIWQGDDLQIQTVMRVLHPNLDQVRDRTELSDYGLNN